MKKQVGECDTHTDTLAHTHTDARLCAKVCLRLMAIVNCLAALFISIIHHQPHCAQWHSTSIEVTEMQLKLTAAYSNACEKYMFIHMYVCAYKQQMKRLFIISFILQRF